MKPITRKPGQTDMLLHRLDDLLNMNHPIIVLTALINWEANERDYAENFPSHTGRPATRVRLAVDLLYLQHTFKLSDSSVLAQWIQNPYFQFFCGEGFMQHVPPVDPSSLSRWRRTLGKRGVSRLLAATIKAGERAGLVNRSSFENLIIDITVMHKDIAFPLDRDLCDKARKRLLKLARKCGLRPRRTYTKLAKGLLRKVYRLGRGRKFKQMGEALVELRRFTELVAADIRRQLSLAHRPDIRERIEEELALVEKLVKQRRDDSNKLYSLHEPHVDCISKGKARMPFEFGVKYSLAVTHKECFVVGAMTFPGAPYDGHTLAEALGQAEEMTGIRLRHVFVDRGYRGHGVGGTGGLHFGTEEGRDPCAAQGHQAQIDHRAGDRAHEERRPSGALPAQGDRGRHVPCDHVRLRTKHPHDPALDP